MRQYRAQVTFTNRTKQGFAGSARNRGLFLASLGRMLAANNRGDVMRLEIKALGKPFRQPRQIRSARA
jgi:hypothetical protein